MIERNKSALVLTGGGARAAYQAGVMQALVRIQREAGVADAAMPFQIFVGTSAGAINAAALACHADDFERGVSRLAEVWWNIRADQVYRTDSLRVIQTGAKWLSALSIGWLIARWRSAAPKALLNNAPLGDLVRSQLDANRIEELLTQGRLHALAVTGSNYSTGRHTTFYQAHRDIRPWTRSQRQATRTRISHQHLLASAAIPFVFPAVEIGVDGRLDFYGDGSMREITPISPAIHLGARRIVVVGTARMQEPASAVPIAAGYPNLAQIAGHALSSIFLDSISSDIERIERINGLLASMSEAQRRGHGMHCIEVLALTPSQRLDRIAADSVAALPATIRGLLRGFGVSKTRGDMRGAALASYLLFEAQFTRVLMRLGSTDTLARRAEVERFFGWGHGAAVPVPDFSSPGA